MKRILPWVLPARAGDAAPASAETSCAWASRSARPAAAASGSAPSRG